RIDNPRGHSRHQRPPLALRPSDAEPPRSSQGGPRLPARVRAGNRTFRARNDVAVLFRSGDARRGFGPVHARADHSPPGLRDVRPGAIAPRDPGTPYRADAGILTMS